MLYFALIIKTIAVKHIILLAITNASVDSAVIAQIQLIQHSAVSNKLNRFFIIIFVFN